MGQKRFFAFGEMVPTGFVFLESIKRYTDINFQIRMTIMGIGSP